LQTKVVCYHVSIQKSQFISFYFRRRLNIAVKRWFRRLKADLTLFKVIGNIIEWKVVSSILIVNKDKPPIVIPDEYIIAKQVIVGKDELPLRLILVDQFL